MSDAMHDVAPKLLPLLSDQVPPFPCGSLVQGLPAALITHVSQSKLDCVEVSLTVEYNYSEFIRVY